MKRFFACFAFLLMVFGANAETIRIVDLGDGLFDVFSGDTRHGSGMSRAGAEKAAQRLAKGGNKIVWEKAPTKAVVPTSGGTGGGAKGTASTNAAPKQLTSGGSNAPKQLTAPKQSDNGPTPPKTGGASSATNVATGVMGGIALIGGTYDPCK